MKRLLLALALLLAPPTYASNLKPIVIADGNNNIPCDGVGHWTPSVAVNSTVAKAYLFFSMSPNGVNGADVMLGQPNMGNNPLAEVHKLEVTPSKGVQGEQERTFSPDRVAVGNVAIVVSCWGGGNSLAYGVVWVD